jgi:hypothetical protein
MANVNYPEKCVLGKARQILKDLDKEIFNLNGEFRFISEGKMNNYEKIKAILEARDCKP